MKLLDVRNDLGVSHRILRVGDLTLMSTRWADGTTTIEVGRQDADGSWSWEVDEPDLLGTDLPLPGHSGAGAPGAARR